MMHDWVGYVNQSFILYDRPIIGDIPTAFPFLFSYPVTHINRFAILR